MYITRQGQFRGEKEIHQNEEVAPYNAFVFSPFLFLVFYNVSTMNTENFYTPQSYLVKVAFYVL